MRSPARTLKRSAVKNIVRFPAIKANGGKTILVESILESKYCLHLEFDPDVITYFPQPKTFVLPSSDLDPTSYTPDFEVHLSSGARMFVEVKPLDRSSSDHFQQLFRRFSDSLQDPRYHFIVVDDVKIYDQPALSNYEKLYQFRKRPTLDMANLYSCAATVRRKVKLSWLIRKLAGRASLREIYSWLALEYLKFDIADQHLTTDTEVEFNVN